jgi:outer membrane protein TolC
MNLNIKIVITSLLIWHQATAQTPVLSLDDCRKMALEQNKKIKAAQYETEAAKAANEAARLNNRPSFDASLMGIHAGKPITTFIPSVLGNASLDIKQPIYAGGKIKLGKETTAKVVELYESQKKLTEADVLLATETAYWQAVQVKEKITLANKYKEMLLGLHKDLQNSYNAGLIYKNDLLRVEVSLNEAELNITKARDGLALAKLNLAQLIGQPGNTGFAIIDSVTGSFDALQQQSFENKRPEITVLQKAIEAEQLQTKIIKADLKPTIGLAASGIGAAGKKINPANGNSYLFTYYGLVNISVPLFDWGKNAKKVKEQTLKVQAKEVQLAQTKELINLQVQNAYLQLNQSVQKIKLSALSLQQADENLRLANDRYKAGTIIGKDVLEAQAIWQQAYTSVIDAKVEYKLNEAGYRRAIGELK